uniref:uncharacterized protein LOC105351305 n=1 Tax=Fragaria vesca subsp. vesca TaxID=101020 RepID=UPI0005C8BA4E|nr:PREDICTED: uncharacterized protein LOC105351305 [Fragaria vesca subsp. vesca]
MVTTFFNKLKALWDERDALCDLTSCDCEEGIKISDYVKNQKTMQFLMGLNENFATMRGTIVVIDPLPSLNTAFAMALCTEKQAEAFAGTKPVSQPEGVAFFVRNTNQEKEHVENEQRCANCNKNNHLTKNCKAHLRCSFCGFKGHVVETCRKKKAAMEGLQAYARGNNAATFDGGSASNFPFSKEDCQQIMAVLNKDKTASANHVGNTSSYENLSGKAFCFRNHEKSSVWILDSGATDHMDLRSGKMIGTGHERDRLYCLDQTKEGTCNDVSNISSDLWHQRLGHPSRYHEPSISGAKYFLTIVDDYTRSTWVYLMVQKSEARKLLIDFIKLVENQFDKKVKIVFVSRDVTFYETEFPYQTRVSHEHGPSTRVSGEPRVTDDIEFPSSTRDSDDLVTPSVSDTVDILDSPSPTLLLQTPTIDQPISTIPDAPPQPPTPQNPETPLPVPEAFPNPAPPHRRSSQPTRTPTYLQDFHVEAALPSRSPPSSSMEQGTPHSLSNVLSYHRLSSPHRFFAANLSVHKEPTSFTQAVQIPEWRDAMCKEIDALQSNHTWSLVPLPPHKRPIGCKWVYKIKLKADGSVERYKARLVAKGYSQIEGVDYRETFAPVAKLTTVRVLLGLASLKGWYLHQLDVNNSFLHGDLTEEVYMKLPLGFGGKGETRVCRLHKSLYGLKQASRQWFIKLSMALKAAGFTQSWSDYSLFVKAHSGKLTVLLVYIDDVILAGNNLEEIIATKLFLSHRFKLKDLGELKYFLGIEVARSRRGIALCQRKYALEVLEDTGFLDAKPSSFPVNQNISLTQEGGELASH